MDFIEKARIKMEHWISHNDHHLEEYESFAQQLEAAGRTESARYVREMTEFTAKGTACLKRALEVL